MPGIRPTPRLQPGFAALPWGLVQRVIEGWPLDAGCMLPSLAHLMDLPPGKGLDWDCFACPASSSEALAARTGFHGARVHGLGCGAVTDSEGQGPPASDSTVPQASCTPLIMTMQLKPSSGHDAMAPAKLHRRGRGPLVRDLQEPAQIAVKPARAVEPHTRSSGPSRHPERAASTPFGDAHDSKPPR